MQNTSIIFSIIFGTICIISSFIGIYSLYSNPKSIKNRLFFALTVTLVIWSSGLAMSISASDFSACLFWRRFSALGWGSFYSFTFHFLIVLTGRSALLNKWWKNLLLYLPSLVNIMTFSYFPGLNSAQYNLIHTSFGWINNHVNNIWDLFYILSCTAYFVIGLAFVWKWGRSEVSKNQQKQAKIIFITFLITFLAVAIISMLPIDITLITPGLIIFPLLFIFYLIKKFGFLDAAPITADTIMFSDQIRLRIIHYLANSFLAGSIINIIVTYFLFDIKDRNLLTTLLFSGFLLLMGFFVEGVERSAKSRRTKDILFSFVFVTLVPFLTLRFVQYSSITIWAIGFVLLIITIVMESRTIQFALSMSIIFTQIIVFILKPQSTQAVDYTDHLVRISLYAIGIWMSFFVMEVFRKKLSENAYQINFQNLVTDVSKDYVSVNESNFDRTTNDALRQIGEFMKLGSISVFFLNKKKDAMTCTHAWKSDDSISFEYRETVTLSEYPALLNVNQSAGMLDIPDVNALVPHQIKEFRFLINESVKSLLLLPIATEREILGYLSLQMHTKQKQWITTEKKNLMIISNIIAEAHERIEQEKRINFMASHDALTELPNRTMFRDRVNQALYLSQRTDKIIAIIFIDIDAFKYINDTLGHEGGDELIAKVSHRLLKSVRKSDAISRFGGDEFLIMLNNISNTKDITKIADKIMGIFAEPFIYGEQEFRVSASAGIAVYPYDGEDADTLIKNADIAMYQAKFNGKNQYCLCTFEMKEDVRFKHELTNKLYRAVDNNELVLHYQPQVLAYTGEIIGVEALVRWNQPEVGFISPMTFIPLAEQNGMIGPIGEWVLRTACAQCKSWMDHGSPRIHVSVNVSVLQFRSPNFVQTVSEVLKETGLEPKYLDLEITESAAVKESNYIINVFQELKELGVNISIDDFGTEYSSLSRLNLMPVNRVKIDISFIKNLFRSPKDQALVDGMIQLSHKLGMKVVAEGVEEEPQLEFLKQHSCDEIQGYLFYRPVPADQINRIFKLE